MLGVCSKKIQTKLLSEKKLMLEKAYSIAQGMEAAIKQACEVQATLKWYPWSTCELCGKETTEESMFSLWQEQPFICYYCCKRCRSCGKLGHIAKMCTCNGDRNTSSNADHSADLVDQDEHMAVPEADELPLFNIQVVKKQPAEPSITVEPEVNAVRLSMELDTGASVSLISERTYHEHFTSTKLTLSDIRLKTYTGEKLKVLGKISALVRYRGQECLLPLRESGPSLFGRNWLQKIRLDSGSIKHVSTELGIC